MQNRLSWRRGPARPILGIIAAVVLSTATVACATTDQPRSYRFEVVDQPVAVGAHSEFDVKLTKASTGEPVANARFARADLEMTMPRLATKTPPIGGGMSRMGGETDFVGTPAPGLYRFRGDVSMSGTWRLDLAANVPGEPASIDATVTFKAGR